MSISQVNAHISHWFPKEASTSALGIGIAAASTVALQYIISAPRHLPAIVGHFIGYSCGATAIAGTVMALYSAIRLGQKIVSEKPALHRVAITTGLGCFSAALAQTMGQHFWAMAPSFHSLNGYSMAYCIGTNFAWQVSAITGIAGIVFTAYAAYRTGQAILATINPATTPL